MKKNRYGLLNRIPFRLTMPILFMVSWYLVSSKVVIAETDFDTIWALVKKNAPGLRATKHEMEASEIASKRAARHWYPRLFMNGKAIETNDPTTSFMFRLNQREVSMDDFNPPSLNQPGGNLFGQGTIGIDFPIYEGGARVAQAKSALKTFEAKEFESKARAINEYAAVARDYAFLLVLIDQRRQLEQLKENISNILNAYDIGAKSNPVGYSGLLGLKNLKNRMDGLLVENKAKIESKRSTIRLVAVDLPEDWQPKVVETKQFLDRAFRSGEGRSEALTNIDPEKRVDSVPASVRAAQLGSEALNSVADAEKARLLPRAGIFLQGDLYAGSRSAATSYSTGVYFQWELFSAQNFGSKDQALSQAAAAQSYSDELSMKLKTERELADLGSKAAERNLVLLGESALLLEEQTQVARKLFQNGSINALQLVEVLSRRADLLSNRSEVELKLTEMKAASFQTAAHEGGPYDREQ